MFLPFNMQNVLPAAPFVGRKVILCFQCAELLKHVVSKGKRGSFMKLQCFLGCDLYVLKDK